MQPGLTGALGQLAVGLAERADHPLAGRRHDPSLAVAQGTHVGVLLTGPTLHGFDLRTGRLLWNERSSSLATPAPDHTFGPLAVDGKYLAWRGPTLRDGAEASRLVTIDPSTGRVQHDVRLRQRSQEITDHDLHVMPNELDSESFHRLVTVGHDFVVDDAQGLTRFDPRTGKRAWTLRIGPWPLGTTGRTPSAPGH